MVQYLFSDENLATQLETAFQNPLMSAADSHWSLQVVSIIENSFSKEDKNLIQGTISRSLARIPHESWVVSPDDIIIGVSGRVVHNESVVAERVVPFDVHLSVFPESFRANKDEVLKRIAGATLTSLHKEGYIAPSVDVEKVQTAYKPGSVPTSKVVDDHSSTMRVAPHL